MITPFPNLNPMGRRRRFVAASDITNGLVGWWKFNEGSGTTAADSSGNGNSLALTNGAAFSAGLVLDGVDDEAACSSSTAFDFGTGDCSISIWAKFQTVGSPDYRAIMSRGILEPNNGFGFYVDSISRGSTAKVYAQFRKTSTVVSPGSLSALDDNGWHFLTATLARNSATGGKMYVDGLLQSSVSSTSLNGLDISGFSRLAFGRNSVSAFPFGGTLRDGRIYNRALSSTEIATLYANGPK